MPAVNGWLTELFDEDRRADTVDTLLAASQARPHSDEAVKAKQALARCDARLTSYRAALDAGGDPMTLGKWIADVTAEREAAAALAAATAEAAARPALTRADVEAAVREMGDAVAMLEVADRDKKLGLYQRLQVRLTYQPHDRLVHVTARPPTRVPNGVSEGGLDPYVHANRFAAHLARSEVSSNRRVQAVTMLSPLRATGRTLASRRPGIS